MTVGPMRFGAVNDSGSDTTSLKSVSDWALIVGHGTESGVGTLSSGRVVGVWGHSGSPSAGTSVSGSGKGVSGTTNFEDGVGVQGIGDSIRSHGVLGQAQGDSTTSAGVVGIGLGRSSNGVIGRADNGASAYGVWGRSSSGYAGVFSGKVDVRGTLTKSGGGFRIDHPLAPETKYLSHSYVESPDMLNVYCGNVHTDDNGDVLVSLPDYFEALNQDFTYQLTVIGSFAQAIVAQEVRDNQFTIKTNAPNVKVSWQVTGVRKDPFAVNNRILVEEDKLDEQQGTYLHPEAYGEPRTRYIDFEREGTLDEPLLKLSEDLAERFEQAFGRQT
jgi:hypothetical protein